MTSVEVVDTVIVGAGQAGIATSEHLTGLGIDHVVLERDRIAERWRTGRWDSLVANGPAWHDRFPGQQFAGDPDAFPPKDQVAEYFERYADSFSAPIRSGVEVFSAERHVGRAGFRVETSHGTFDANHVVAATGPFQRPLIPELVPEDPELMQLHSSGYRNPDQLPPGAVVVVGAGSSGAQIAEELLLAGRQVYLCVGPHDRPPRTYRGQDYVWWLGVLGYWDAPARRPGLEHVTIAVSGAYGGHTIDFRTLAAKGMTLVGRADGFDSGTLTFADDLAANLAAGDTNYLSILDEADAYVTRNGLDMPPEPEARVIGDDPECVRYPLERLHLRTAGVNSIIWATGFRFDFGWLKVDTFDETGRPRHFRGVSEEPGLYFVGLPWQSRRASSFIYGVWFDAKFIADQIATRLGYLTRVSGATNSNGG
jgi:putative flavoprotein involved in K+ transport